MPSVSRRIDAIKQPRGGCINIKKFSIIDFDDGVQLNENENIAPGLVGTAVDYLTRYLTGASKSNAFKISLLGARNANETDYAQSLLKNINGLDELSITNACKLAGYDCCYRVGMAAYRPVNDISPNKETIQNISIMVKRSLKFFEEYGPVVLSGFDFDGAYTNLITSGDGDYLTKDTLWDFKVSKKAPQSKDTLQLLVYYIMGHTSKHKEFQTVRKLGIWNPRLCKVYILNRTEIADGIVKAVAVKVIGYKL